MTDTATSTTHIDTGTEDLLARIDGNVGVITFNRPERRNALSEGIYAGFAAALPVLRDDPAVRVVMVTGNGNAFCAGGDVKGMHERNSGAPSSRPAGTRRRRSPTCEPASVSCRSPSTSTRSPSSPRSPVPLREPDSRSPSRPISVSPPSVP